MIRLATTSVWALNAAMAGWLAGGYESPIINPDPMSTTVKVSLEKGGHGSATHIGNGYFITAGHVATEEGVKLTAKFKNGKEFEANTLWSNHTYDIALLQVAGYDGPASNIECRDPELAEDIALLGNPLAMEFIQTYGKVSGEVTAAYDSAWQAVTPLSGAMAPGMSGGGAFDEDGDLVGVNVGIPLASMGYSDTTFTGISFIVPGSAVCGLLGRVE